MSIECGECERDLRGGHDEGCSRYKPPCGARREGFKYPCERPMGHQGSHDDGTGDGGCSWDDEPCAAGKEPHRG